QRRVADVRFGECIAERKGGVLGTLMRLGVRVGGHPIVPAGWRWGYGRSYPAGYDPAREAENEGEEAAEADDESAD
ncbi:MAG: hypothetical protein QNK05_02950, partial [Myxococcota bacterium]|nr:hypothetical protein [Myxococcota bacterium]